MTKQENETYTKYLKSDKWKRIAEKRMEIDGYTCCMCGCRGTSVNPLEVHHLTYRSLYHEENRIYEDVMTLCHSCHKLLHKGMERKTNEYGRKGWKDNARIPDIHVYTLTGETLKHKEREAE